MFLAVFPSESQATHIVGGELNYTRLTGNNYRVELKLYKDCGTSIVPFDDPATIYIYNNNDQYIGSFEIPIVERDTLESVTEDDCLFIPPDVCVDFARYEIVLPLPGSGLTLAYIRCCRNATILNAEGEDEFGNPLPPDLIGATYSARIPPDAIQNSNPVFREFPPIILCSDQVIDVDQSASDADGDSLVYSLCTPNTGGSLISVFGDPLQEAPPFDQINWVDPYDLDNILGANPPLTINSQTGRLRGRAPQFTGQFVVGVCVREYRNGEFLSENKRDFQFNVADCRPEITAEYTLEPEPFQDTLQVAFQDTVLDYVLLCDTNLIVQFHETVTGSDTAVWNFGDGSPPVLASDPVHEYADTGFYVVTLVGGFGQACADTFRSLINVQYQRAFASFEPLSALCYEPGAGLAFTNTTSGSSSVSEWSWDFGDGTTSAASDPLHFYAQDETYTVSLTATESTGCVSEFEADIEVERLQPFAIPDSLSLCDGDSVRLGLDIEGDHLFEWQPAEGLDDIHAQQPLASPSAATTYTVTIRTPRADGDTCLREAQIAVVLEPAVPEILDRTVPDQCGNPVELTVEVSPGAEVLWSDEPTFSSPFASGPQTVYGQESATADYYVQARRLNCVRRDTVTVNLRDIQISGEDVIVCRGETAAVRPTVFSTDADFSFEWGPPGGVIDNSVPEYVFTPEEESTVVTLEVTNATGCSASSEFNVTISTLPELNAAADPPVIFEPGDVRFRATPDDNYAYQWMPPEAFDDPTRNDPTARVEESDTFTVTVTDLNGCPHTDTVYVRVLEPCGEDLVFIPTAFSPNGDGLNDVFRIQIAPVEAMELAVFDRWGNEVFSADHPEGEWDGSFEGRNLGNDVFGYILTVVCIGGDRFVMQGSVTLVR